MTESEMIVVSLANCNPGDGGDGHLEQCAFCGARVEAWLPDYSATITVLDPGQHDDECVWRRAVEYRNSRLK